MSDTASTQGLASADPSTTDANAVVPEELEPTISVGADCIIDVVSDGSHFWASDFCGRGVLEIDPASGEVLADILVEGPRAMAFDGANVWGVDVIRQHLVKIDPVSADIVAMVPIDDPVGSVFDGSSLWITNMWAGTVSRIDPSSATVTATLPGGLAPDGIAFDGRFLWVANGGGVANAVSKVDPRSGTVVTTIELPRGKFGGSPRAVAFGHGHVWVADPEAGKVSKIDPSSAALVSTFDLGASSWPEDVIVADGSLWVALSERNRVLRLDPVTGEVQVELKVRGGGSFMTAGDQLWIAGPPGRLTRLDGVDLP